MRCVWIVSVVAVVASAGSALGQSMIDTPARLDQSILPQIGGGSFGTNLNNAQFYPSYTAAFTEHYLNQNGWFFRVGTGAFPLYDGIYPLGSISLPNTFAAGPTPNVGVYSFINDGTFVGHFDAVLTVTVTSAGVNAQGLPRASLHQKLVITNTDVQDFTINLFNVQSLPLRGVSTNTKWTASNYQASTGLASRFNIAQSGGGQAYANVMAVANDRWQFGRNSSVDAAGISTLFAPSAGSGTPGSTSLNLTNKSLVSLGPVQNPDPLGGSLAVQWTRIVPFGGSITVDVETTFNMALPPPPCPADLNGDSVVNTADLTRLLSFFGQSIAPGQIGSDADVNQDGVVNTADLAAVLGAFGSGC